VIGVIAKPEQTAVVEEFFELFKTPWEFYDQDRVYDVVLATSDHLPDVDATLLLVYGSAVKNSDAASGIDVGARGRGVMLDCHGSSLPIYGPFATFRARDKADNAVVTASGGIAGLRFESERTFTIRLGYDLFDEARLLISAGQPVENAHIPTLDAHIEMLREWILSAGVPLLEIPPVPSGHSFVVCLTHDIDFVGIRNHFFDHSMWGFVYRSSIGGVRNFVRRRISSERLFRMWRALVSLPFVYLGWAKDFWNPFEWYLRVEKDLPVTYFLIPFKGRAGERVPNDDQYRAAAYDVSDLPEWTAILTKAGCELGVHGIDAWHSADKGREELARIGTVTGQSGVGIRMHWLLHDTNTAFVLEQAGYAYDSTAGYNETIGYRNGTTQVFRPLDAQALLELPLHIQDGALFFSNRLDLSEPEAWARCGQLIGNAGRFGGVLTLVWHDRSHGPERFWGDFYARLVQTLKSANAWFGTASQVVGWFRKRREVRFGQSESASGAGTSLLYSGEAIDPPLRIRLHHPSVVNRLEPRREPPAAHIEFAWNGRTSLDVDRLLKGMCGRPSGLPRTELCPQW